MAEIKKAGVVGAGMMGTALCTPLADAGHEVRLVGTHLDGAWVAAMKADRRHPKLAVPLPDGVLLIVPTRFMPFALSPLISPLGTTYNSPFGERTRVLVTFTSSTVPSTVVAPTILLRDGHLATGRNSPLMHAASSLFLNAVKHVAGIPDALPLLRRRGVVHHDDLLHPLGPERGGVGRRVVQDDAAHRRVDDLVLDRLDLGVQHVLVVARGGQVEQLAGIPEADRGEGLDLARLQRQQGVLQVGEGPPLASGARFAARQVVDPEHDIL